MLQIFNIYRTLEALIFLHSPWVSESAHYLLGISIYNWNWCHVYNPCLQNIFVEVGSNLLNRYSELSWPSFNHVSYNMEKNNDIIEKINIILVSYLQ